MKTRDWWRSLGRQFLSVLAGYATMILVAPTITWLLRLVLPVARDPSPPTLYAIVDLTYSLGAVAAGGAVCAYVARRWTSPIVLATVVLILGIATAFSGLDVAHPDWYTWGSALLSPVAVLLGTVLALKARAGSLHG